MGRAGKDRLDDRCVGFTVEGRVEDDGMGWDGGMGMCARKSREWSTECWLMDDSIE